MARGNGEGWGGEEDKGSGGDEVLGEGERIACVAGGRGSGRDNGSRDGFVDRGEAAPLFRCSLACQSPRRKTM